MDSGVTVVTAEGFGQRDATDVHFHSELFRQAQFSADPDLPSRRAAQGA
jgi:hypothetical protein